MTQLLNKSDTVSSDKYPFLRINRSFKIVTGIGMGVLFGCMINALSKKPYLTRPHIHIVAASVLAVVNYKTYDMQEYFYKKNFAVLQRYQERVQRQEFVKSEIEKAGL
eukprot:gene6090-7053_t